MLYVIGLGLSDEKDITVKGLEVGYPLASSRSGRAGTDYVGSPEMREGLSRIIHLDPHDLEREAGTFTPQRGWIGACK